MLMLAGVASPDARQGPRSSVAESPSRFCSSSIGATCLVYIMIKWWWHLSRELKYDGMDGLRPKVQPGLATRWNNNRDNMPCALA